MGYTHYWSKPTAIPADTWALIVADARRLIADARSRTPLCEFGDDANPPRASASGVSAKVS